MVFLLYKSQSLFLSDHETAFYSVNWNHFKGISQKLRALMDGWTQGRIGYSLIRKIFSKWGVIYLASWDINEIESNSFDLLHDETQKWDFVGPRTPQSSIYNAGRTSLLFSMDHAQRILEKHTIFRGFLYILLIGINLVCILLVWLCVCVVMVWFGEFCSWTQD